MMQISDSTVRSPLHLAFENICTAAWIAGCHYLKNLFVALRTIDSSPELVLFDLGEDDNYKILTQYLDRRLVYSRNNRPLWKRALSRIQTRTGLGLNISSHESEFLQASDVDVLFTTRDQGPYFQLPWLFWLTDFQHLHLPEMFSAAEVERRNLNYARAAAHASRVILSSQNALEDFRNFAPGFSDKARVLPFVAQIPANVYDVAPRWICEHYHLPERFIFLPNQWWKHKNHRAVMQALSLIKGQHPDIVIVCTGSTYDYRNPGYFPQTLSLISELGLRDNMIVLGTIPHEHVFVLMRQALAVLQPSTFEGWSTTVEETKTLGKSMILSDIPIHRDQAPTSSVFFDLNQPESLADCLIRTFADATSGPDEALEVLARADLPQRTRDFGNRFMEIARELVYGTATTDIAVSVRQPVATRSDGEQSN